MTSRVPGGRTTPPTTTPFEITGLKVRIGHGRQARVTFATAGASGPVTFECRVDAQQPRPCRSHMLYRHLSAGAHLFAVKATEPRAGMRTAWATARFRIPA